jgi:hypothetical protein
MHYLFELGKFLFLLLLLLLLLLVVVVVVVVVVVAVVEGEGVGIVSIRVIEKAFILMQVYRGSRRCLVFLKA